MQIDVFTLFPEWFGWFHSQRHVRNALRLGHELRCFNYRDTTPLPNGQVDDSPYGGGAGMLIRVDVVDAALQAVYGPDTGAMLAERRVAVLTPAGRQLDDGVADELAARRAAHPAVRPLRGHGRARARAPQQRRAVGRPLRAVRRRAGRDGRGGLGAAQAARARWATSRAPWRSRSARRSRAGSSIPHYTRPASYRGWDVPEVLLSGHHEEVQRWRSANISRPR